MKNYAQGQKRKVFHQTAFGFVAATSFMPEEWMGNEELNSPRVSLWAFQTGEKQTNRIASVQKVKTRPLNWKLSLGRNISFPMMQSLSEQQILLVVWFLLLKTFRARVYEIARWWNACLACTVAWVWSPEMHKRWVVTHTYNPHTWDVETGVYIRSKLSLTTQWETVSRNLNKGIHI